MYFPNDLDLTIPVALLMIPYFLRPLQIQRLLTVFSGTFQNLADYLLFDESGNVHNMKRVKRCNQAKTGMFLKVSLEVSHGYIIMFTNLVKGVQGAVGTY